MANQGAGYPFAVSRDEGIYDWQTIAAGASPPADVIFFQTGFTGNRDIADTNLEQAGVLPGDRASQIVGVSFFMAGNAIDAATGIALNADIVTVINFSVIQVFVNDLVALEIPTAQCAADIGITGNMGGLATGFAQAGAPDSLGYIISDPERFIEVTGTSTVRAVLHFSASAPAPALNAARRVMLLLRGPQAYQAGRA